MQVSPLNNLMQNAMALNTPQFGVNLDDDEIKAKAMKTKKTGKLANTSDLKPKGTPVSPISNQNNNNKKTVQ